MGPYGDILQVYQCTTTAAKRHSQAECTSETTTCTNCGMHHVTNKKNCPAYLAAKEIFRVKSTLKVSYNEARRLISSGQVCRWGAEN